MLFLLTGDVQIGKTRWLERLAAELSGDGVQVAGVLAPGVWRVREPHEVPGERGLAGEGRFEKLGIDNVLLPGGERVPFARRRDLALAEGSFDPTSQSASAQLAWEIADEAIARVNAHFDRIAAELAAVPAGAPALPGEAGSRGYAPLPVDPAAGMFHVKHSFAQTYVSRETSGAEAGETPADPSTGGSRIVVPADEPDAEGSVTVGAEGGLLVVDELGRLELMRDGGLVSAVALLERGPSARFPMRSLWCVIGCARGRRSASPAPGMGRACFRRATTRAVSCGLRSAFPAEIRARCRSKNTLRPAIPCFRATMRRSLVGVRLLCVRCVRPCGQFDPCFP